MITKSVYFIAHFIREYFLSSSLYRWSQIVSEASPHVNIPLVKVRQILNDFFKLTFLPKNEQTNSTLLLVDWFSLVFWKKVKTPKRHFEINWPLWRFRKSVNKRGMNQIEWCFRICINLLRKSHHAKNEGVREL